LAFGIPLISITHLFYFSPVTGVRKQSRPLAVCIHAAEGSRTNEYQTQPIFFDGHVAQKTRGCRL